MQGETGATESFYVNTTSLDQAIEDWACRIEVRLELKQNGQIIACLTMSLELEYVCAINCVLLSSPVHDSASAMYSRAAFHREHQGLVIFVTLCNNV